jgi:hypothetical protein
MAHRTPSLRHKITDKDRINWLETMAKRQGGLLLHDGTEKGRTGLGLNLGFNIKPRTLRQAIDQAYIPELPKKTPKKKKPTYTQTIIPDHQTTPNTNSNTPPDA